MQAGFRRSWRLIAAVAVGAALVLAATWYILENPFSQTFGHTITQIPVHQKVVALTFDDGPNPPYTNQIVEYLHTHHAVATFFDVGVAVDKYPDAVRLEVQSGDAVGNHTWDHAHLVLESRRHIEREITLTDAAIFRAAHVHTRLFRPPFGARDYAVINIAHHMGYAIIMWSVPLPRDWQRPAPSVIAARVLRYVKDGSIITLHDGNRGRGGNRENSVEATKIIVDTLQKQGYRFVTVPELMRLGYEQSKHPQVPGEQAE